MVLLSRKLQPATVQQLSEHGVERAGRDRQSLGQQIGGHIRGCFLVWPNVNCLPTVTGIRNIASVTNKNPVTWSHVIAQHELPEVWK